MYNEIGVKLLKNVIIIYTNNLNINHLRDETR